ncbi:MlrC domain-containing protein [Nitratireductor aquibiodomus RA22]|uniref:MlrC domain-containing protein n=1 Tax=Nitratireductor aquibiodomus RA22 TaxID=1189611 RepID=I5BWX6_9HYPH|nr:MlrC domain-containing protein [Nitratireductor aquibiodomus RA22]
MAEAQNWEVIEGLCTYAQPAGPTVRAVYETMRDDILSDLRAAMPVDVVLMSMHGAMIAQGYDDCEGDMMARVREIVGPDAIIGLELDPHCHLTTQMLDNATAIVCYKEYPHVDVVERAEDLFALCAEAAAGRVNPVMRDYDCRMMAMYHTPFDPIRSYVDRMSAMEGKDGILSVSLVHGFPWGDSPRCGTRTLVIADGNASLAERRARELGQELWAMRNDLRRFPNMEDGLDLAVKLDANPVVLADFADNAGGGAPSDSTFVLRAALERESQGYRVCNILGPGAGWHVHGCGDRCQNGRTPGREDRADVGRPGRPDSDRARDRHRRRTASGHSRDEHGRLRLAGS